MGIYSEYIDRKMTFQEITDERKLQLRRISELRENRDILVYASDLTKNNAPISIDYNDILPFSDQLANLKGTKIDIILETPGGLAEIVEDLVKLVRGKYESVGIIVPGSSKSAGTIFAMAGDEILMGKNSALGPIDAQIVTNGKRFSADAFLEGLKKIKEEIESTKKLNPAYIPMLQNISPGEIQHCENAQDFSQKLVSEWLVKYKFKYWQKHKSTGKTVTLEEKTIRAKEIAKILCDHSFWLTHSRSIKIEDFDNMKLLITDYSLNDELDDAITKYYTLLRMSFDSNNLYKIFETCESQIYKIISTPISSNVKKDAGIAEINIQCSRCKSGYSIQANVGKKAQIKKGNIPFPKNNVFVCPKCKTEHNLLQARMDIENQTGLKIL